MKLQGALVGSAAILVLAVSGVVAFATIAPKPDVEALLQGTASIEAMPIRAEQVLPAPEFYIRE